MVMHGRILVAMLCLTAAVWAGAADAFFCFSFGGGGRHHHYVRPAPYGAGPWYPGPMGYYGGPPVTVTGYAGWQVPQPAPAPPAGKAAEGSRTVTP
jgi:hypothetical protein